MSAPFRRVPGSRQGLVVALDGPASSGKSSVGGEVAQALGYRFVDTGLLYRGVTWLAQQLRVALDDGDSVAELVPRVNLRADDAGRYELVLVDGMDVTEDVLSPTVDRSVSEVARQPAVRTALLARQRDLAEGGDIVMAGRDIGTVVLPDADVKVFLEASPEERARRRAEQRGFPRDSPEADAILGDLRRRDAIDRSRATAPLRPAEDAVRIVTDGLALEETIAVVLDTVRAAEDRRAQERREEAVQASQWAALEDAALVEATAEVAGDGSPGDVTPEAAPDEDAPAPARSAAAAGHLAALAEPTVADEPINADHLALSSAVTITAAVPPPIEPTVAEAPSPAAEPPTAEPPTEPTVAEAPSPAEEPIDADHLALPSVVTPPAGEPPAEAATEEVAPPTPPAPEPVTPEPATEPVTPEPATEPVGSDGASPARRPLPSVSRAEPPLADHVTPFITLTDWVGRTITTCVTRVHIEGLDEPLDIDGPLIIASNHASNVDGVLVACWLTPAIGRRIYLIGKQEALDVPLLGWALRQNAVIGVRRGAADLEAYRAARRVLDEGHVLGLFPEGTRSPDGRLQPAKEGAAILALRTGAPILPVGVSGTHRFWPRSRKLFLPGGHIRMRVGTPFRLPQATGADRKRLQGEATRTIMTRIAELLPRSQRGVYTEDVDRLHGE